MTRFTVFLASVSILLSACSGDARQEEEATAHYLANEGVMVIRGETKIAFDPLFENSYGQYELLPENIKQSLMNGAPPYDGIDAVFISHYHGDHFSPAEMLQFLRKQDTFVLVAPRQAVDGMQTVAAPEDTPLFDRITPVDLEYGDAPIEFELGGILVEAVRIPHSGWPASRTDVQNIAFRITLDDQVTVLHLGDADTTDLHFSRDEDYWDRRKTHMAFPPYWYFLSKDGRRVLDDHVRPGHAVGVHVPTAMPDDPDQRPAEFQGFDLFTEPGETRTISTTDED